MNLKKKFLTSRNLIPASFLVGLTMAVAGSVYATSVGSDVSVTGTLTVSSATSLNGGSTFGDAAADVNLFTGTLQASTTALFTNGLTSYSNIGIGTTSPAQLLSVQGGALISGTTTVGSLIATSTLFVGNTGNLFNVMQGGQAGIGTTSPSAKFAFTGDGTGATRAFVIADSSNIERISVLNNGFVGHSSTSPWGFLSVEMGSANPAFVVSDYGTSTPSLIVSGNGNVGMGTSSPGGVTSIATAGSVTAFLLSNTGTGYTFWAEDVANDSTPFVIDAAGSVGIGTTTPGTTLAVAGSANITGTSTTDSLVTTTNFIVGAGDNQKFSVRADGNVGVGTSSPGTLLGVSGSSGAGILNTGAGNSFYINDVADDTTPFVVGPAGNTGIGTSTPGQELSVNGDFLASSAATTSIIIGSTASRGGCIQLQATNGTWIRIYATTTPTLQPTGGAQNLVVEAGACQ